MDFQSILNYCLSKRGAYEDYPFGRDVLVVKIAAKMFALISERNDQINISLKCNPILADNLRHQYPCITPGYHLNKTHWNTVLIDGTLAEPELFKMIDHSYDLIFKGLKKIEKETIQNEY